MESLALAFSSGWASGVNAYLVVLVLGVFLLRGVLTFFSSYCLHWVSHRLVLDLRGEMFSRLIRFPSRYFDDQSSGVLLSKVAYDVSGGFLSVTGEGVTVLAETATRR